MIFTEKFSLRFNNIPIVEERDLDNLIIWLGIFKDTIYSILMVERRFDTLAYFVHI